MSNEKQETIADIVSEMRIGDLCASDTAAQSMYINDFLASYADRIEAAEKREREATREKPSQVGNASKMREALNRADAVLRLISKSAWFIDANFAVTKAVIEAGNAIEAALAAPPRNCDRLSADKCKQILKMEMDVYIPQEATDNDREIAQRTAYGVIDALFAPYTEQKGETDGSK